MCRSARHYYCCHCQAQVIICSSCDPGHRYCTQGCAAIARSDSLQRAGKKYQLTRAGRFNNADRQQRYRERQKQKVTHRGSLPMLSHDLLKNKRMGPEKVNNRVPVRQRFDVVTLAALFVSLFYARNLYNKAGFYVDSGINPFRKGRS